MKRSLFPALRELICRVLGHRWQGWQESQWSQDSFNWCRRCGVKVYD